MFSMLSFRDRTWVMSAGRLCGKAWVDAETCPNSKLSNNDLRMIENVSQGEWFIFLFTAPIYWPTHHHWKYGTVLHPHKRRCRSMFSAFCIATCRDRESSWVHFMDIWNTDRKTMTNKVWLKTYKCGHGCLLPSLMLSIIDDLSPT